MADRIDPEGHLPLTNLSFHILLALGDGPAHGYAIGKEIQQRSDGRLDPATGSLYQALKRLREAGLIEEAAADGTDSRRQSFTLTELGRDVVEAEACRLDRLVGAARSKRLLSRS